MKPNALFFIIVLQLFVLQGMSYAQKASSLFVHYDKTVYTENETVWFTAYLLKTEVEMEKHKLLSVALINEDNRRLALEERFLMKDGFSYGNMKLPDTIAPGNYYLVAYTNMKKDSIPIAEYIQPITVKTTANQTYELTSKVLDTATTPGEVHVLLSTRNAVFQRIPDAALSYTLGRGTAVNTKTNKTGQYLIKIPKSQIGPTTNTLTVQMKHEGELKHLSLQLPYKKSALEIGFYPEGGHLVADLENRVGWEAKLSNGRPISLTAVLYSGAVPIDTIQTSGYGIGQFRFRPKAEGKYSIKLKGAFPEAVVQEQYELPKVKTEGVLLGVEEAITEDTLQVNVASGESRPVVLKIHKEERLLAEVQLTVGPKKRPIKVDLSEMPRGLTTMTLYDTKGSPLAERIFFAHYHKKPALKIETSSATYKPREKVHLKLSLDDQGRTAGLLGMVSIACVQSNRLEVLKQGNIESYFYLEQNLNTLPVNPMGKAKADKQYLEDILLVKGWRRYTAQPVRDVTGYNSPEFSAVVTRLGKPLKKPVSLMLLDGDRMQYLPGDSTGLFKFKNSDLTVIDYKKLHFFISNNESKLFEFRFSDPYSPINTYYTKLNYEMALSPYLGEQSSEVNVLNGAEKVIKLEEVVIRAQKDNYFSWQGANECGDYVCAYNILNCMNHSTGTPPIKGKMYNINGRLAPYYGCSPPKEFTTVIRGINMVKEFYGSDYSVFNPSDGEYLSTIYWKHSLSVKKDAKEISFYTSDITGKFKVIVQGATTAGVVYAESEFEVRK